MDVIIITGANRGIGFECALTMAKIAPEYRLILACRNIDSGERALRSIAKKTGHKHLKCLPLDLASLKSIDEFANLFNNGEYGKIAGLVNNAGIQNVGETRYTTDGFEENFGVNHLGSFALSLTLLSFLSKNARITFVTSGTHDPAKKTGVPDAEYTNADLLAHPKETDENTLKTGQKRYATSKLCTVMIVYQLKKHLAETSVHINAFAPGLVPGTGLARNYPPFFKFISNYIFKALIPFSPKMNSAKKAGETLAEIAHAPKYKAYNGTYFEKDSVIKSSKASYNSTHQQELWDTSLKLIGKGFSIPSTLK